MLDGGIIPVLLSDGEGSPLRLLSCETYPKQLLSVLNEKKPLQQSALQVADRSLFAEPILIANAERRLSSASSYVSSGFRRERSCSSRSDEETLRRPSACRLPKRSNPDAILLAIPVGSAIMWRSRPRLASAWRPRAATSESGTSIIVSEVGVESPKGDSSQ
jgi:hypothetical protein